MKDEFIAAAAAEQASGTVAEISAVLNRLPREFLRGTDDRVVDAVDALMDELYRQGRLHCPGHRWLNGPPPPSIREHLVRLHADGNLFRDATTGMWMWSRFTSYFTVPVKRRATH
ncbi:hypothetical protein [Actinoplanes sp. GCM10030250]|uniref:hypothetical protein n=1 Tax=Actinoplanes sp. GCM10030250 TaxID=3273376 RepID=UPI0036104E26